MRKQIIQQNPPSPAPRGQVWLDMPNIARVEISSEEPEQPVEAALTPGDGRGWRAAQAGEQTIRLLFDEAQHQWSGPIGIGFPAAIQRGIARTAANVDKSLIGLPIAEFFSRHTNCSVYMANDADAAGLAEIRFGAGKDIPGVVLIITIGTGLGTARFMDGHLQPNTELGHIYLDNGIEAERYASEAVRVVQKPDWSVWGARLIHYLTTIESLLWPDLIVLGGGVSNELKEFAPWLTTKAPVVAASFLNQAGIVGAALFAEEALKKKH